MLTYRDLLLTGPEAVCVLDAGLSIRQHNQFTSLLLGYRNRDLTGHHLSDILYDDMLTRHLLASDSESDWFQGECVLKTSSNFPLIAKFRAGLVVDDDLFPNPGSDSNSSKKSYVLVFREADNAQDLSYERRIKALRFLLDAISGRDMEPLDILLGFARIFDRNAEVMLLTPDLTSNEEENYKLWNGTFPKFHRFSVPQSVIAEAKKDIENKISRTAILYRDDNLSTWCFFHVCPPIKPADASYTVACIKFAIPRLYNDEDKKIFSLAGMILGLYMDNQTSSYQGQSFQSLFQTILNSIDCPIVIVDSDGLVISCNTPAQILYGYKASEMIGKPFDKLAFPMDCYIRYEDLVAQVTRGETIRDMEMTHLRSDLSDIDVNVTAYPYTSDDGLVIGAVFVLHDLREKKHLQNKMLQWEKLAVLGELLSSAANELNNYLTPVTGFSQLLRDQNSDGEIGEIISIIDDSAKRCGRIVSGVLNLACDNYDELNAQQTREEFSNANKIIIAALDLKRYQLWQNNIRLNVNLGANISVTVADPRNVEFLFLHIINYAEQRMLEYDNGGEFTIESSYKRGRIVVRFTDTGTHIPENILTELSDPFFVGNASADEENSWNRLGLSFSYQILRNNGGKISFENLSEKRNIVTVELPAVKEVSSNLLENMNEIVNISSETGKRILVVDDNPGIINLLVAVLQYMGHISSIARDGEQAMRKLNEGKYDLIISDLRMPCGFTGDKLYKFIKLKNPDLARRMIFITGDVINPETRKFLQSTGNPYLEKPFPLENLKSIIQNALSRGIAGADAE